MLITEFLERNARLYKNEIALTEINPSDERDRATTWREASLIELARPNTPYKREMTWSEFDTRANRFANLLIKSGVKKGDKVLTSKYSGTEVKIDDVEYTIVKQSDILAIVE